MEPEPAPPQPSQPAPITTDHLPSPDQPHQQPHKPNSRFRKLARFILILIVVIGFLFLLSYFFASPNEIVPGNGGPLIKSLKSSKYAVVERVTKYFRQPQIGDLVLFDNQAEFESSFSVPYIGVIYEIVDQDNIRTYKAKVRPESPGWEFTQEKIFAYAYYPRISQSDIDLLAQSQPTPEPTPTPTPTPNPTADWQTLESDNFPVNLNYPPDWNHYPNASNNTLNLPYIRGFSKTNETLVGPNNCAIHIGYGGSQGPTEEFSDEDIIIDDRSFTKRIWHENGMPIFITYLPKTHYIYEIELLLAWVSTTDPTACQDSLDQILSTFEFTDTDNQDQITPTTTPITQIPVGNTSDWVPMSQNGISFKVPPQATYNNQTDPGTISWTSDYQGDTIYHHFSVYILDYQGGSRRQQFYQRFPYDTAQECRHIYQEAQFGSVKALQIAGDGGWCQGGSGGIVTVVGDKLIILSELNYNSDTKEISRFETRDTFTSTLSVTQ